MMFVIHYIYLNTHDMVQRKSFSRDPTMVFPQSLYNLWLSSDQRKI